MQADRADAPRATRESKGSILPAGAQQTVSTVISAAEAVAAALEADSHSDQAANKPCCPGTSFELKTDVSKASCLGIEGQPGVDLSRIPSTNASTAVGTGMSTHRSFGPIVSPDVHHSVKPGMDPSVHSSLHHSLNRVDPSRAPSAAMCTDPNMHPSMDPRMHPSREPSATLCTDPGVDPQSGSKSNDCPVPSAISDFNLTFQLPPTLSQAPSPAPIPGAVVNPQPVPTPVANPSPKPLPTPVADTSPSPSPGVTPEPATPLLRLKSFDLFLDQSPNSSTISNSPKLMLNPSQTLAEAEHQSVSESWAYHDVGTPHASAKPPPFTPTAGRSPILIPQHIPSADPKEGLNPHSVPYDCQIPGLLSDSSLDSWTSTATDSMHNFESNSSQGFRCSLSTDLTDCPAPAQPPEFNPRLKQVQGVGDLPLGKSSQSRRELPKGGDLPKGSAHPMSCEQPTGCELLKGNFLTAGEHLMRSDFAFPRGGPSPMGWGPSPVGRGPSTACAYPVSMNANACEKLCFGSLNDFLSSFAEPAPVRVPSLSPGATGFAIMAEPLDQMDYLLRLSISPGATVCAVVTHQPAQVQPTLGGSSADASAQLLLPQCTHARSTPQCGVKSHNGKGAAALASAETSSAAVVAAASPAVAAVSPAVGPSTPGGTTEVLYPEPRKQLHAVSTVSHSEADGSSVMAISAPSLAALHPDGSEMPWAKGPLPAGLQMAHALGKGFHPPSPTPSRRQYHHHNGAALVHCSSPSSEEPVMADEDDCSCEGCLALLKCNKLTASCRDLSCTEQQALLDELVDIQVSMPPTCAHA